MKTQLTIIKTFDSYADARDFLHKTGLLAWNGQFTIIDGENNPIEDLTEWAEEVRSRDKYYMMSDDFRVWSAGDAKHKRLLKEKEVLIEKYGEDYIKEIEQYESVQVS